VDGSSNPWAEEISIDEETGLILNVGTEDQIVNALDSATEPTIVDMKGRLVLPGFQDVHLHAVEAGINANICLFDEDSPIQDLPYYFEQNEYCLTGGAFGDQGWIVGAGVDIGILQETIVLNPYAEYPITVLDRAYPDTPVFILDAVGHGAVANTAAMDAVGYSTMTTDPPGGILDRDPDTGELTGIVLENAQQPLRDAAFPPTEANQETAYQSLLSALRTLAANGITSVSDAGGFWRQAQTEAWARAEEEGVLTVRASNALYVYPDQPFEEQLPELLMRYSNDSDKLVRFNQAKIYVDGIPELATAALYEPYDESLGLPEERQYGFEYFGDDLQSISQTLAEKGFLLYFHMTGDRGAGLALDAIANSNYNETSHRLTHCFLVGEQDRERFAALNAIADFQSAPSTVSVEYRDFMATFIGETRADQLIPTIELMEAGATLTLSSDWDADELSPLLKIQTILTRPDGRNFDSVETVIPMLTRNAAVLLQTNTGTLEAGKLADLVVLDQNIFEIETDSIADTHVLVTIFNGKVVYDPDGILQEPIGTRSPMPSAGYLTTIGWCPVILVALSTIISMLGLS
jgi:predicted amidohydrolase YtcJ